LWVFGGEQSQLFHALLGCPHLGLVSVTNYDFKLILSGGSRYKFFFLM
jgi:hypothetical protein